MQQYTLEMKFLMLCKARPDAVDEPVKSSSSWEVCHDAQGESGSQDYRVVSAGQDDSVRMWDPYDMTCLRVMRETRSELTALTFFAAGNTPITGKSSAIQSACFAASNQRVTHRR